MKIGIIGSRGDGPHDETAGLNSLLNGLNEAGETSVHFDPLEGSDDPNPGRRTLNRQRWRQNLYRRHKEVELLHCLHLSWSDLAWAGTTAQAMKKPTVASVDGRLTEGTLSFRDRTSVERALETIGCFIASDEQTAQALLTMGCSPDKLRRLREFHLPRAEDVPTPLPTDVAAFLESASPLFVASGPIALHQTQDEAGFDLLIEAFAVLGRQGLHPHLLAIVENPGHLSDAARQHWELLQLRIPQAKLEKPILWTTSNQLQLRQVLPHARALVRPTPYEEDPIVLHRALQDGISCVASDAATRPSGTTLFRNRDALDLARVLTQCIQSPDGEAPAANSRTESLLSLYRALLTP